jgi:hypothetical protein
VTVIWYPEIPDEGEASFRCLLCPDGWNRFFINWDPEHVTNHTLRKIRRHFSEEHGIAELPLEQIAVRGYSPAVEKAAWFPAAAHNNSGFYCRVCPGSARMFIDPPTYGEARQLEYSTIHFPELARRVSLLPRPEQAEYIEAWSRGLIAEQETAEARRQLRSARRRRSAPSISRDVLVADAVKRLILDGVRYGEQNRTTIIKKLAQLAKSDPERFTQMVGARIPGLNRPTAPEVLTFLGREQGALITYSERSLWKLWQSIPEFEREEAIQTSDASERR